MENTSGIIGDDKSASSKVLTKVEGGVTRHNFGSDDIVIMTGKKGASRNDNLVIGPNEQEEV